MKINLEAKGNEQMVLLNYLEENASEVLASKINNGVPVEKDGKRLIMKKTLAGFMKYALEEAKKTVEKGVSGACIEDKVVFGWLIHYFEEDSIEGTLYNEDGTEYKAPVKTTPKTTITKPKPVEKPKKQEQQFSLFDMISKTEEKKEPPVEEPSVDDDDDELPSKEEIDEIMKELAEEELKKVEPVKPTLSPFYAKYKDLQDSYPQAAILYRLGDFYEILGDFAVKIADELNITLTGRDCGLESRVPMVGFPYHCSDTYMLKIHKNYDMVVYESEDKIDYLPKKQVKENVEPIQHWIDDYTYVDENGVVHELPKEEIEIPAFLKRMFPNIIAR